MENNFDNILLDTDSADPYNRDERPAFLTVLCILTFIGVGCGLIYDLYKIYLVQVMGTAMELIKNMKQPGADPGSNAFIDQSFKYYKYGYALIGSEIGGNLAILAGAILMWKQKVLGYMLYLAGQIVPIVIYFSVMGLYNGQLGMFGWLSYVPYIFTAGFLIMYALNIKHMKK